MAERSLPAVYMRGGTSRALFFHARDLPERAEWDAIFCAALGSPDPDRRQLDGMGGGITSLSKIAVIGPPTLPGADVDYTFAQVDVTAPVVGYRGNCGNISSAVGPYAVARGLVPAHGATAEVMIHNTNTAKLIRARFSMLDGVPAVEGNLLLDGVAGSGAPIELGFLDPAGAATGRLFPTGGRVDRLKPEGFEAVAASLIDVCNPVAFLRAADFGLAGSESVEQLAGMSDLLTRLAAVRAAAAVAMGLISEPTEARTTLRNLPLVALLAAPSPNDPATIVTRMFSSDQPHKASPLTAAMCLAAAILVPGTLAHKLARPAPPGRPLRIRHASGTIDVAAYGEFDAETPVVAETVTYRTARRLMEGRVYFQEGGHR